MRLLKNLVVGCGWGWGETRSRVQWSLWRRFHNKREGTCRASSSPTNEEEDSRQALRHTDDESGHSHFDFGNEHWEDDEVDCVEITGRALRRNEVLERVAETVI